MPLTKKGRKVKSKMAKTYGAKKGGQVFYATMSKQGEKSSWEGMRKQATKMLGHKGGH